MGDTILHSISCCYSSSSGRARWLSYYYIHGSNQFWCCLEILFIFFSGNLTTPFSSSCSTLLVYTFTHHEVLLGCVGSIILWHQQTTLHLVRWWYHTSKISNSNSSASIICVGSDGLYCSM